MIMLIDKPQVVCIGFSMELRVGCDVHIRRAGLQSFRGQCFNTALELAKSWSIHQAHFPFRRCISQKRNTCYKSALWDLLLMLECTNQNT